MAINDIEIQNNISAKRAEQEKMSTIYSTAKIEKILNDRRKGVKIDNAPFFQGNILYKDAGLIYQYTDEELEELEKCSLDCNYFVESYAKFLNDKGRTLVTLRDYQHEMLHLMGDEVWSDELSDVKPKNGKIIMMMSRQSSKCVTYSTKVTMMDGPVRIGTQLETLKGEFMPYTRRWLISKYEKAHKWLYKCIIGKSIELIDTVESKKDLKLCGKFIKAQELTDEVHCDHGSVSTSKIFKTVPYQVWRIELENRMSLECADEHVLFIKSGKNLCPVKVMDLKIGDNVAVDGNYNQSNIYSYQCTSSKVVNIVKYPFKMCMYDLSVRSMEHRYFTDGILSHNTTTTAAYITWYMVFHNDRNIAIVANKGKTASDIIRKVKDVFEGLPFYMKPGIVGLAKTTITLENGCYLMSATTNPTSVTGQSVNILYLDEAAHIPVNIMEEFWRSVYPTLSSFKQSQIIISSTPKGKQNLFYRLYDGACKKTNNFINYRVDWWQVPGHDDAWAENIKADLGLESFNQEYGLQFDVDSTKLITSRAFKLMDKIKKTFVPIDFDCVPTSLSSKMIWHPDFDPSMLSEQELAASRFLLVVDTAEGKQVGVKNAKDSDWNVINIYKLELMSPIKILSNKKTSKITEKDVVQYKQVGLYLDNDNDEEQSAEAMKHIVYDIFKCGTGDIDNCRVLLEMNFNGKNFLNIFMNHSKWYDAIVLKTYHVKPIPGQQQKKQFGFKTTGGQSGKNYYCELGSKMVANRQIIVSQYDFNQNKSSITELSGFGKNSQGKYEGSCMHDDIAVTVLFVSRVNDIEEFIYWVQDWIDGLPADMPKVSKVRELLQLYSEDTENEDMPDDIYDSLIDSGGMYQDDLDRMTHQHEMRAGFRKIDNPYLHMNTGIPSLIVPRK